MAAVDSGRGGNRLEHRGAYGLWCDKQAATKTADVAGRHHDGRAYAVRHSAFAQSALVALLPQSTRTFSVRARWDGNRYIADPTGNREPICELCARQLLQRFEREQLPIPSVVRQADYFERAYHAAADEQAL